MDNEEAVSRLEQKLRVGKLDSLLLFVASSFALVFTLLQVMIRGYNSVIFFFPLLFLGSFMPIYVGYLRGAILLDSILERVRGWLYLVSGVGFYVASLIAVSLLEISLQVFGVILGVISFFLIGLGIILIVIRCSLSLPKVLFKITDHDMDKETKQAIRYTAEAASILGAISYLLVNLITIGILISYIIVVFLYVLLSIYLERKARYWSKKSEEARD